MSDVPIYISNVKYLHIIYHAYLKTTFYLIFLALFFINVGLFSFPQPKKTLNYIFNRIPHLATAPSFISILIIQF